MIKRILGYMCFIPFFIIIVFAIKNTAKEELIAKGINLAIAIFISGIMIMGLFLLDVL